MKSPKRDHYSRVNVDSASVKQGDETFTVTVTFTFDPWDAPAIHPVGYAADALAAVSAIIESGFDALREQEVRDERERDELFRQEIARQSGDVSLADTWICEECGEVLTDSPSIISPDHAPFCSLYTPSVLP